MLTNILYTRELWDDMSKSRPIPKIIIVGMNIFNLSSTLYEIMWYFCAIARDSLLSISINLKAEKMTPGYLCYPLFRASNCVGHNLFFKNTTNQR